MDYEIQKTTRLCTATGREISAGETFFSVLTREGAELKRFDYSADAWPGPPAEAVGWWKSTMPDGDPKKPKLAPSEVLLELFRELEKTPERQELRCVLSLLLIRRRLLRLEENERDDRGREVMVLYCPRDEQTYRVVSAMPDEVRAREIQEYLGQLLFTPVA